MQFANNLHSLNIFIDLSGTIPRIARVIHDYGDGKEIARVKKYNTQQGKGNLLHVKVTKDGLVEDEA